MGWAKSVWTPHIILVIGWWRMKPITDWAERAAQTCRCPPVVVRFSQNRLKKEMESRNIRDCKISVVSDWRSVRSPTRYQRSSQPIWENFLPVLHLHWAGQFQRIPKWESWHLTHLRQILDCWTCRHHQNQPNPKKSVWVEQVSQFEWVFGQSYSYPKMTWLSRLLLHYYVLFYFSPWFGSYCCLCIGLSIWCNSFLKLAVTSLCCIISSSFYF